MNAASPCKAELRPAAELGFTEAGGLAGVHHFCFSTFQRTDRLEWGDLRALHYYVLSPGQRRNPTFHAGFEIVTLVESGRLRRLGTYAPRDPMEAGAVELISPGMGATLGVEAVGDEPARFLEIWIRSSETIVRTGRQTARRRGGGLQSLVAVGLGTRHRALSLNAEARICRGRREPGELALRLGDADCAYLFVLEGDVDVGRLRAHAGDALALEGPGECRLNVPRFADILLIETRKAG